MFEKIMKGVDIISGAAKKEKERKLKEDVSIAIRRCLEMRNVDNSLATFEKIKGELSVVPHPYSEESYRLWELKKIEFNSNIDQTCAYIQREIDFVRDSGVLISNTVMQKMEDLKKDFLLMKFKEVGSDLYAMGSGGNINKRAVKQG